MIKRGLDLLVLGFTGFILIVLYFIQLNRPDPKLGGFLSMILSMITVLIVLAYIIVYVIKIYNECKNLVTTTVFSLIPFIIGGFSIYLLSDVFKVNLAVGDTLEMLLIFGLMTLTYISPILCYLAYNFKKIGKVS